MASHARAGKLRPHVTNDLEVPRHVIQHLGDVLAQPGHAATTVRADAGAIVGRLMHDLLAWQMIGQRLALRLVARATVGAGRSAASARAVSSAAPVSNSSSWNSSCSIWRLIRSDERPNCMRRNLAIWNRSFSISSAFSCTAVSAAFNSLWQASANARNSAGSIGSSAVASDMSQTIRPARPNQNRKRIGASVTPTLVAATAAVLACAANPSPRSAPKTVPA